MRQESQGCCLDNDTIEGRLKAFLLAKWRTQEVAAERLGYTQPELSRWIRSVREMSASRLAEFVVKSGANGHYILTGEGDPLAAPGEAEIVLARVRGLVTDRGRIVEVVREASPEPVPVEEARRLLERAADDVQEVAQVLRGYL
jgi:hypothetical protein